MCIKLSDKVKYRVKDGYVTAWKVITVENTSEYFGYTFKHGANVAEQTRARKSPWSCGSAGYTSGFHCFLRKKDAVEWNPSATIYKIIKVLIREEDITSKGYQGPTHSHVVVAKRIEIPSLEGC